MSTLAIHTDTRPNILKFPKHELIPPTPIAEAMKAIKEKNLISFHALPLSKGATLQDSALSNDYYELLGERLLGIEHTVTGEMFDSFFFPASVIKAAEQMAAETFGADGTIFGTAGTTVSNQIALAALCQPDDRVLLDRCSHQSLHFALKSAVKSIDYLAPSYECKDSGRTFWSLDELLERTRTAELAKKPYTVIVLNGSSYDGVVYDIPFIIHTLLENGVRTRKFLVDEAWGIGNYFNRGLSSRTAMSCRPLLDAHPDLVVVSTQSAHKSIATMRQASMIHYIGTSVETALRNAKFRLHTTSPSYPILLSLDLARAQMQASGRELVDRAILNAATFRDTIAGDAGLSLFTVNDSRVACANEHHVYLDPTKISINLSSLRMPPKEVRAALYNDHNIYVNRFTETSLLFNFHIGISAEMTGALIDALREQQHNSAKEPEITGFIVAYPPGTPLAVPGDRMTSALKKEMLAVKTSGNLLVHI